MILIYLKLFSLFYVLSSVQCLGTIELDEFTFEKVIDHFPMVLVKFDVPYPYGDKYEAYNKLARETAKTKNLLIATVGVKDYGEKENSKLADRFKVDKDNFPVVFLFKRNIYNPIPFVEDDDHEFNLDNLKLFIKKHADSYVGLPGCLEKYDKYAGKFMNVEKEKQGEILAKAEKQLKKITEYDHKKSATYYIKLMSKIIENSENATDFVIKEQQRLENLKQTKLAPNKFIEIEEKLNIIKSFLVPQKLSIDDDEEEDEKDTKKTEL